MVRVVCHNEILTYIYIYIYVSVCVCLYVYILTLPSHSVVLQGQEDIRYLRGAVVTQLCLDYGMIDDAVYFTGEQVLGGVLLKAGDLVDCMAVRDHAQGGWRALRVRARNSLATLSFLYLYRTVK